MIKYDNKYYEIVIEKFKYDYVTNFLNIDSNVIDRNWICSYNLNEFIDGFKNGNSHLIIMGMGINGVPHMGTVSQMLKAIYLQKMGFNVQIVLGDLDVYGARSKPLEEIRILVNKYKSFLINLGFDTTKGIIRNQFDFPEIIRTSFLLARCINDKDFEEIEEDINELYKTERVYQGMDFSVKQSISLMFADFIHPGLFDKVDNVLVISGIDEHGYVYKADEIRKRMGIKMSISGLYSKMMRGLNDYPKMSKSIPLSSISLSSSKNELRKLLLHEKFDYTDSTDSFVYQLMKYVSFYDTKTLNVLKKHCDNKSEKWLLDIENYVDDLYNICKMWR